MRLKPGALTEASAVFSLAWILILASFIVISGDLGKLFELPAGAVQTAFGATYRTDKINDTPGAITLAANASTWFLLALVRWARPWWWKPAAAAARPGELTVATTGGVTVDNAKVIKTDIAASNGVIHVIDTVVMPK